MRYACYVVFDLAETWYKRTCRTGPQQLREVLSLCQRASAFIWQAFVESVLNLKKKKGEKKGQIWNCRRLFFPGPDS